MHPGLYYQECSQQVEGSDPYPLFSPGKTVSGVLCPVWGSLVQERHGHTGASPAEGNQDGQGAGEHDIRG